MSTHPVHPSSTTACDMLALAAPGVQSLQPYQPGKPESELRRELGLEHIIKLASNENPLGPSPKALAALSTELGTLARYPEGSGFELKQALAARHHIEPACITLGNGSNDVLELLARAFLTPEHEVIFSAHAFAVYPLATQAVSAVARVAPAHGANHPMPYGHDLQAFQERINKRTRLIFIANPNNPTGTWLPPAELEAFIAATPAQTLVVVDEAYFEYADTPDYASALPWLEKYPNLVICRTFSKAYGLAGLRVGYALSHPQIADLLNRVRQPFNVNSLALAGALAALDDTAFIARSQAENNAGLQVLQALCDELKLRYLPSQANFLCIDFGRPALPIFQALLQRGIIVRPVANYGLPDHLRITIGTTAENTALAHALREIVGQLQPVES